MKKAANVRVVLGVGVGLGSEGRMAFPWAPLALWPNPMYNFFFFCFLKSHP